MPVEIVGLHGLPEVRPGDDLAALIRRALQEEQERKLRDAGTIGGDPEALELGPLGKGRKSPETGAAHEEIQSLEAGAIRDDRPPLDAATILVVAQKIVSKAEGAVVDLRTIEPSALARDWAARWDKEPRLIELVLRQSRRIVKMERGVLITETYHGLVTANAGVDASNMSGGDQATILPADPDASAQRLRESLGCGAVIITDTFGRPWREGLVNVAIGVAGVAPLDDYRGVPDHAGRPLQATVIALADELAAAAGLVARKTARVPVVLIRGLEWQPAPGSARDLIRPPDRDLFR